MDFATSVIPGWHTTIFPPYFVSGAVFSGFAMVQTLLLIMRKTMNLENYIHTKHVEYMNIVIIVTGSIVGVAYLTELFISWYSGVEYESYAFINRFSGPYSMSYWIMMTCNVVSPQLFWFKKIRRSLVATFALSIVVNIGMWFRALRDHCDFTAPGLRPFILGRVPCDQHRCRCLCRYPRHFLHTVLAVCPVLSGVGLERVEDHFEVKR